MTQPKNKHTIDALTHLRDDLSSHKPQYVWSLANILIGVVNQLEAAEALIADQQKQINDQSDFIHAIMNGRPMADGTVFLRAKDEAAPVSPAADLQSSAYPKGHPCYVEDGRPSEQPSPDKVSKSYLHFNSPVELFEDQQFHFNRGLERAIELLEKEQKPFHYLDIFESGVQWAIDVLRREQEKGSNK